MPSRADVHLPEAGLRREDTAALERPDDYHALFIFTAGRDLLGHHLQHVPNNEYKHFMELWGM